MKNDVAGSWIVHNSIVCPPPLELFPSCAIACNQIWGEENEDWGSTAGGKLEDVFGMKTKMYVTLGEHSSIIQNTRSDEAIPEALCYRKCSATRKMLIEAQARSEIEYIITSS